MKYTLQHIIERFQEKEKLDFLFFWGHTVKDQITKSCFSQWFPIQFEENGILYKTAEHYMMAGKAKLFNDQEILEKIVKAETPDQAKSLGRKVKNFDPKLWDEHKYEIVKNANLLKFSQNSKFKDFLLSTDNKILVEASPYDRIWGIGMLETDSRAKNPANWDGENLLGFALMEVRDQIRT
ncbi:NADAR family protein [Chryseobacterium carnipullorum]|uniref:NADAR family protein n=1 Tax=Chryseobacterium carnipullorum TaxID=1124835 RepID=A0A3G6NH64_CHRCU|nr:NADAR family protein [Chryseobacterium carnipullorum]AZA47881.1 NADAR family protein [Chryseobacterium carnipullorum]AZA67202.1 NADAR family protein [Chryseobacterium carnipullorum]